MNLFGVAKLPTFGTFGEYNIINVSRSLRVRYILTKMRPSQGEPGHSRVSASHAQPFAIEDANADRESGFRILIKNRQLPLCLGL